MPVDLRVIPLFRGVENDALRELAARVEIRSFPQDSIVWKEGDPPDALYVVVSGRVKVYLNDEAGRELVLSTKGPGEYFGEMMLDDKPRSASVMTLEPAQFAVLSRTQFTAFILGHPEVALQLIRDLIRMGRGMNVRAREHFRHNIEELQQANVHELASVKRWRVAQSVVLVLVLLLASLQFFFFAAG